MVISGTSRKSVRSPSGGTTAPLASDNASSSNSCRSENSAMARPVNAFGLSMGPILRIMLAELSRPLEFINSASIRSFSFTILPAGRRNVTARCPPFSAGSSIQSFRLLKARPKNLFIRVGRIRMVSASSVSSGWTISRTRTLSPIFGERPVFFAGFNTAS